MVYYILDIIFYLGQGLLLAILLWTSESRFFGKEQENSCQRDNDCFQNGSFLVKDGQFSLKNRYTDFIILVAAYLAVHFSLHNSEGIRSLLYGGNTQILESRQSITVLLLGLFLTYLLCRILFRESRLKTGYEVISFYAVTELIRLGLYPLLKKLLELMTAWCTGRYLEGQTAGQAVFLERLEAIQIFWNVLCNMSGLVFTFLVIWEIRKILTGEITQKWQWLFLLFPGTIGLFLCVMIRSILFSVRGSDMQLLLDDYPEMNVLIPGIAMLCIGMMIAAAKMVQKLTEESNRRIETEIYQSRIRELEEHIGDMEGLYEGIQGMRHDMKNYIADMDALMKQNGKENGQEALRQYLDSLQQSVDQLDMKYHTGNPVTDVVIQRYARLAERNGISFQTDFLFPAGMKIDAFDLSILINNGLENAIEACKKQAGAGTKQEIEMTAYRRKNMFFLTIWNSFNGTLIRQGEKIKTSKPDLAKHGLGLRNIEACAEKYLGRAEIKTEDGQFELTVMLQGRE